jgi:hypothetical protein
MAIGNGCFSELGGFFAWQRVSLLVAAGAGAFK